ncbi:MAG: SIMPL domain-containing protein, partial [Eudoraea sp.]|nr:SIMPL domain-containing protein [Eudoraea sp.]
MKELDWAKTLIIFIGLIIAGYFVGNMHKTGKQYDRYVQVKGLSEREVAADMAVWPINITLTGNDLNLLKKDIEAQNDAVNTFFINQGFKPDEITRGTTNISDARANLYNT